MNETISKYELAIKFENNGYFLPAYTLFKECLNNKNYSKGDILFHCGWCVEHSKIADKQLAINYYIKAADADCNSVCRMNSYFRAGWIQMHLNNYSKVVHFYSMAIKVGHSEGEVNSIYTNAVYWCAVSLEESQRFLDAINLYRKVRDISVELNPESRYREILALTSIGKFSEALDLRKSFEQSPPVGFSEDRYSELKNLAEKERKILEYCFTKEKELSE